MAGADAMQGLAEAIDQGALPVAIDQDAGDGRALRHFIEDYLRAWNAKDAGLIWHTFYALDPGHRLSGEAALRTLLDGLVRSGWDHSRFGTTTIHAIDAGRFVIRVGYTRYRADGSVVEPAGCLGAYVVRRRAEGLRITALPLAGRPLSRASRWS